MVHLRALVSGLAVVILTAGLIHGQGAKDTKDKKDAPAKLKGSIPKGWTKLKLTNEQKQKVYKIRADYQPKIEESYKQYKEAYKQYQSLKDKEKAECVGVLNSDQKEVLKKLALGESSEEKKEEKKK